jgi:hypothetical protein
LLHQAKLLKGCIGAVLSRGHLAIEGAFHSCSGMIAIWVLHTVLIPRSSGVADETLFCKHHSVPSRRVNSCNKLKHVLDSVDINHEVLLLMAAIVG